jgi:hypothetical protein
VFYTILGISLLAYLCISSLAYGYFSKAYDHELNKRAKTVIILGAVPFTFVLQSSGIFIAHLNNINVNPAFMFIPLVLLLLFVNYFLIKIAHKFQIGVKYV